MYANGWAADQPHPVFSGSKSFWGPLTVRAQEDGLLKLDEFVVETLPEWRASARDRRGRITVRMLLALTAGYGFGGLGAGVPTYDRAIAAPLQDDPGSKFTYGGIPFQVLGAVLSRKLAPRKLTPHEYLEQRVLQPAGSVAAAWRTLKDGTQPLPTGAFLTARNWLAYGSYMLAHRAEFAACFAGSRVNARYGLGWWLGSAHAHRDLVYASGAGGQGLYLVPSLDLVAVRFGKGRSYKHEAFARALLA